LRFARAPQALPTSARAEPTPVARLASRGIADILAAGDASRAHNRVPRDAMFEQSLGVRMFFSSLRSFLRLQGSRSAAVPKGVSSRKQIALLICLDRRSNRSDHALMENC
jgi:hypothetical protein